MTELLSAMLESIMLISLGALLASNWYENRDLEREIRQKGGKRKNGGDIRSD